MTPAQSDAWRALGLGPRLVPKPAAIIAAGTAPGPQHPMPSVALAAPVATSPLECGERQASPASIATADQEEAWLRLKSEVAACTRCGLCESRTQTVFGVGDRRPGWLIVGEAPGAEEDRRGEPFVGAAGQLLDSMLTAVGRSRAHDVFIVNVLKCRPPGNRNPAPQEIEQCLPYLHRQIEMLAPRLILALGRFAIAALTGADQPVSRMRGRVHRYSGPGGEIPLVAGYHPAYYLRRPEEKRLCWEDLCLARSVAP